MRSALLALVLSVSACAPTAPSPADLAALADAISAEEYADTFLDELEVRLDDADHDLTRQQFRVLRPVMVDGAEAQRTLIAAHAASPSATFAQDSQAIAARTDQAALQILTTRQEPVYLQLRAETRAILRGQFED